MDISAFSSALDQSITSVADREFNKLSNEMQPQDISSKVHNALESLGRPLRDGIPPNYKDPWVALFYLTWHQPGHIQLGRLLIENLRRMRKDEWPLSIGQDCLQVFDFGCGSLAMQFAVAWTASDAIEAGKSPRFVELNSYDASSSIINLGDSLWKEFTYVVSQDSRLRNLSQAIGDMEINYGMPGRPIPFNNKGGECILSAMHTAYRDNITEIKPLLAKTKDVVKPSLGLLSGHANWNQQDLLGQASPFDSGSYNAYQLALAPKFTDIFPEITKWRRDLNKRLVGQHPFLNGNVTWKFEKAWGWTYSRVN